MKQYEIINEYGYEKDYSYLNIVVENAIKKLGFCGTFSCTFIDDDKMHELNKTYRNIDKTTDVLSFAINDGETKKERLDELILGDIFISIPKMKAQAIEYETGEKRELAFLLVHGLLHLLGYDHMNEDEEKEMFNLQEVILNESEIKK